MCVSKTHLTPEGFFPRVLQRVHLQRHAALKRLPARLTRERHVLRVGCGQGHTPPHSYTCLPHMFTAHEPYDKSQIKDLGAFKV